jgi:putative tricarboxylic transport membrane protein
MAAEPKGNAGNGEISAGTGAPGMSTDTAELSAVNIAQPANAQAAKSSAVDAEPRPKGLRSDQVSGLMLLVLGIYVGWQNRAYPLGSLSEPGPGYVPMLLAFFLGGIGLFIAVLGHRSKPVAALAWPEATRAVVILIACGVATFAIERLGYRLTIIAMLVFFMGVLERRPPLMVGLIAVGFGFASYYVIADLLRVPLPRSPWGL